VVTYPSIRTLYLRVIGPSTQKTMHIHQLFLVGYYFHSNMAAEHIVVTLTFRLKVEDALVSFEEVQTKIKEIEERTTVLLYR